jgi:endonuclease YncB( thermonuclease family)
MKKLLNALPLLIALLLLAYSCSRSPSNTTTTNEPLETSNAPKSSETWRVAETRDAIHDGDTIRLTNGSQELKVRFCGIDAPELKQPMGIASRDYLRSLIAKGDGTIYVTPVEKDRYGRTVAELFVPLKDKDDDLFLNGEMVRAGYAWHYQQYSGDCPNKDAIAVAEEMAKESKAGVWANPNSQPPWVFRRQNR